MALAGWVVVGTINTMTKKKAAADRHKPSRMVRIKPRLAEAAAPLVERLDTDFTQLVNESLRLRLEAEGLWPPPKPKA